jgi:polysaccharide export outer membrane protein
LGFIASVAIIVTCWWQQAASQPQSSQPYRLAAGDKISIQVLGQPEFSIESFIDASGGIRLPMVGDAKAADTTPAELEARVSRMLEQGYLKRPVVSVRVVEYRPIYVVGLVRIPGPLTYRGGETVLAVIARSGGVGMPEHGAGTGDVFQAEERVRVLEVGRAVLVARKARLVAQQNGAERIEFPKMSTLGVDMARIAEICEGEQRAFTSEREAEKQEADALRQQIPRLRAEIATLKQQEELEEKQRELNRQLLADYEQLAKSGLARKPTYIEIRREEARIESNIARLKSEGLKAELSIGDIQFKLSELHNNYQRRVLTELRETDRSLLELTVTLPAARRAARARQSGDLGDEDGAPSITVIRSNGSATTSYNASVDFLLQPGDVVQVGQLRASIAPSTSDDVERQRKTPAGNSLVGG